MRNQAGRVQFLGSFDHLDMPTLTLPEVAFAGRSNVGKSSALNTLLQRKKAARVSGRPGRTQRINLFQVGDAVIFADLPGYGFARVPDAVRDAWKPMIEGYLGRRETLKLVVVLVDARREPQELDLELVSGLVEAQIPCLVVTTKVDKLKKHERKPILAKLADAFGVPEAIPFSSVSGEGRDRVWQIIEQVCRPKTRAAPR
ncbi:MAG: ribosome biogenesis GTP-binding protein YihA/YsxC [Myxococcota bacterium]